MVKRSPSTPQSEKRQAQRLSLPVKVIYSVETKCTDISGKGLRLLTKWPLAPGDKIDVIIQAGHLGAESFATICKIVWCKQLAKGKFEAGLRFIKIKKRETFMQFICEKMLDLSLKQKTRP